MSLSTTPATRFDSFDVYKTSYKKVGEHEIEANVLVPKDIKPGKCPVMIKWHGGGLTAGTALYPNWFAAYFVPFLHRNNAIAILPNYRLTPENSGSDILTDIADFHTWFRETLPSYLFTKNPSVELDFAHVLVHGDSAGGWCALQSILAQPQGTFTACFLQYPVTSAFPTSPDDILMGQSIPPKSTLDAFIASIPPGSITSSAMPPARAWLAPMLRAHGRWEEFFGEGKHVMPDTAVTDAGFWVPMWIVHGRDDSVVSVEWTEKFVERVRGRFPHVRVEVVSPEGDHGFDAELCEEDVGWLGELLKGVEGGWLG
ncbi:hypothetical protein HBI65_169100 [Parastagonospora nodorum]|nr:hypothetical protein HBI65_169100 [Parastagonospora nodorum]KAH6197866.1 hypothetical protein HBI53_168020 [Parastagonospora nodorum]